MSAEITSAGCGIKVDEHKEKGEATNVNDGTDGDGMGTDTWNRYNYDEMLECNTTERK